MKHLALVFAVSLLSASAFAQRTTDDWSATASPEYSNPTRPGIDNYRRSGNAEQARQQKLQREQAEEEANLRVWKEFKRGQPAKRADYTPQPSRPQPRAPEPRFDRPWYRAPLKGQAEIHILPNYRGYNNYDRENKWISNFDQIWSAHLVAPGMGNAACFSGYIKDAAEIFYQMVDEMNELQGTNVIVRMYTYYDGRNDSDALKVAYGDERGNVTGIWFDRIQRCNYTAGGKKHERWSTAKERANRPY